MKILNFKFILSICLTWQLTSCGNGSDIITQSGECDLYTPSAESIYKLPFYAGESHEVSQGNCSSVSHFGSQRYAYDIVMDIGNSVVAVRDGIVTEVEESFSDGNGCPDDNHVYIKHSDGTVATYVHLTNNGVLVSVGDSVTQGNLIAHSGNTGCSGGPHLHFAVFENEDRTKSVPVSFNNTTSHLRGLKTGSKYKAL